MTCSTVDWKLHEFKAFTPASQLKDLDVYDLCSSQNNTPVSQDDRSCSPEPWDWWQPFELTDNYSEPSTDDTIGMGWTARYAKKDTDIDSSDFTEDFTDDEEYDRRLLEG